MNPHEPLRQYFTVLAQVVTDSDTQAPLDLVRKDAGADATDEHIGMPLVMLLEDSEEDRYCARFALKADKGDHGKVYTARIVRLAAMLACMIPPDRSMQTLAVIVMYADSVHPIAFSETPKSLTKNPAVFNSAAMDMSSGSVRISYADHRLGVFYVDGGEEVAV